MQNNRRDFIKKSATLSAAVSISGLHAYSGQYENTTDKFSQQKILWPVTEGPDTPKICVGSGANADEKQMQLIKQMGIDYVLMGGPRIPWKAENLRTIMERFKSNGLTVINMMIGGHNNAIYGKEGRDDEIAKIKESIVEAGKAGLPVIEYNWYVDRLMEGYYEMKGRGGSVMVRHR
jgi:mannonate dehydratase